MAFKSVHIVARQMFYLLAISTILILAGLLAAVWLSDEVAKRKDEIAAWASQQTGYPVEIGNAGIYLFDLIPKLELDDLNVSQIGSDQPLFQAKQIYLKLDLISTLQQQSPVLADIRIQEANFAITRDKDGKVTVEGLKQTNSSSDLSLQTVIGKMNWLEKVELNQVQVRFHDEKQATLSGEYQFEQLELRLDDDFWQLNAQLQLPSQLGNELNISGSMKLGRAAEIVSAEWAVNTTALQIGAILSEQAFHGVKVNQGAVTLQGDFVYSGQENYQAELDLELNDVVLVTSHPERALDPVKLDHYHGVISLQHQRDSWAVSIPNHRVTFAEQNWPVSSVKASKTLDGQIQFNTNYVNLSDITALSMLIDDAPSFIKEAKPAGDISMLSVRYQPEQGVTQLSLKATELGILPWQKFPGVDKLSFKVDWEDDTAQILFDSHQTTIFSESWLTEPAFLESLTGQVTLAKRQQDWRVELSALRLWNSDFTIQADGFLSQSQNQLDSQIQLSLQDVIVNRWKAYVPEHILQQDFREWSAPAFVDGRIAKGHITMKGDPRAFPFDQEPEKGAFDMQLQAENVQLHYGPGWPDLMQVNGDISGQGNNLLITSQSGMIAEMQVNDATVEITNLVRDKPLLTAQADLKGDSAKALAFLKNSPLKDRFGDIAEWLTVTGTSDIDLNLAVPLASVNDTDASGQVSFNNTTLTTKAVDGLQLDKVNGSLHFNNHGVTAESIQAVAFNRPVDIKVTNQSHQTWVDITGDTTMRDLKSIWPDIVPTFVTGQTPYRTRLIISESQPGDFGVEVDVESDLKGITVNTPQPLAKVPTQAAKFNLNIAALPNGELGYQLQYSDKLSAFFSFNNNQKLIGEFILGNGTATLRTAELAFIARLDDFNADSWQQWQLEQPATNDSFVNQLDRIVFETGTLTIFDQELNALQVKANHKQQSWLVDVRAEQLSGQVTLPSDGNPLSPIQAHLAYLKITLPEQQQTADDGAVSLWPAMDLTIDDLKVNQIDLGQLSVNAFREKQRWILNSASLNSPKYSGKLNGVWSKQNSDLSQFTVEASTEDLKSLLGHFGYQQSIDATDVRLTSQLSWADYPLALTRENMVGQFHLNVGRGKLVEVDPGAAGRIFGLMSIAALPRRLSLDFSDLFKKGFNFSGIKGQFDINNGIANTNDFVMKGDSATIELNGPINLVDKTYNQTVRVRPEVSSTLPIAGAVAGGPIGLGVGTAILLFDKIAGKVFDKELVNVISYQYSLTGPWENPQLSITSSASQ